MDKSLPTDAELVELIDVVESQGDAIIASLCSIVGASVAAGRVVPNGWLDYEDLSRKPFEPLEAIDGG